MENYNQLGSCTDMTLKEGRQKTVNIIETKTFCYFFNVNCEHHLPSDLVDDQHLTMKVFQS